MTPTRILIVEDHFLARIALHSVLAGRSSIQIVGEACDGAEGVELYRQLHPDIVLLDLRLPKVSGFDVLRQIRKEFPTARCIILSSYHGSEDIYRALHEGAMGYLTKDVSGDEIINAILSVSRNLRYIPKEILNSLAERIISVELTPRETEVLTCITHGYSNREIAEELHIAEKTVRIHVSSILDKLGARDRTQATIYALQRGFVDLH
jgi:DNA-binding NarL/FixJ family response regulator